MFRRLREGLRILQEADANPVSVPRRPGPSLAEEVFLVELDPERERLPAHVNVVVSSALVLELVHEGRLEVSGAGRKATVRVVDTTPLGDPELDDLLVYATSGLYGPKVVRLILWSPTDSAVEQRLIREGVVVREVTKKWGLYETRHQLLVTSGRDAAVARIRSALAGESVPDQRTAILIGLLTAGHGIESFAPKWRLNATLRRAREIAAGLPERDQDFLDTVRAAAVRARRFDD